MNRLLRVHRITTEDDGLYYCDANQVSEDEIRHRSPGCQIETISMEAGVYRAIPATNRSWEFFGTDARDSKR